MSIKDSMDFPRRRLLAKSIIGRLLTWGVIIFVLLSVVYVPFLFSSESKRKAALGRLKEPESLSMYSEFAASRKTPRARLPLSTRSRSSQERSRTLNQAVEDVLEGWERLFEELERIQLEMDLLETPHDIPLGISLKGEQHRTPEEQALVNGWNEAEEKRKETLVTTYGDFICAIRDTAKRGGPVFPLDFSEGWAISLPHLSKMRALARLLAKHAEVAAKQGDYEEAVADILAGLTLAEALSQEPLVVSQITRFALTGIMSAAVQSWIRGGDIQSDALFDMLIAQIAHSADRQALAEAVSGDAILGLDFYDRIRSGDETPLKDLFVAEDLGKGLGLALRGIDYNPDKFGLKDITRPLFVRFYPSALARPWVNRDEQIYADAMARVSAIAALPYYEAMPAFAQVERQVSRMVFRNPTISAVLRVLISQAGYEATLHLMQTGLTLERFYMEHGTYPDTLQAIALGPAAEVPLDPFTGEPYHYKPQGETFLLYSVGRNLIDDGGRHDWNHGDIVWRDPHLGEKENP